MANNSVKIQEFISKGLIQDAYLFAENQFNNNPDNLEDLKNFIEVLLRINQKPLIEKSEEIIKNSKYDHLQYPDLSFLLTRIYSQLGDVDKIRNHRKECENKLGWKNLDDFDNIEDISSKDSEDLSLDNEYYKSQLIELVKYLFDNEYSTSKKLKKIYNLLNNNYTDDAYYLLKEFAQNLKDRSMTQFILAELALTDKKFDIAEKWYNKIIDRVNNKGIVYNRLGDIYFAQGKNKEALAYYSKSYQHNPHDENTNLDLIRTHILDDNIKEAKKLFVKATDKFGTDKTESLKGYINNKVYKKIDNFVNGLVVCLDDKGQDIDGMVNRISFKAKQSNKDQVIISGNLSYMTIESIKIAESLLYEHFKEKINQSITVIWEHSVAMQDGDSAGLAITVGLISIASNRQVPNSVAFTGAINHDGSVRAIGGLNRKLIASYIHGIKKVYIPKDNFPDLQSVDAKIKSALSIKMVTHYKDVIGDLWN